MSYDPPSETRWVYTHRFDESYAKAYEYGFDAAAEGKTLKDNPYKHSTHERQTTYDDELSYWWYSGHEAYLPGDTKWVVCWDGEKYPLDTAIRRGFFKQSWQNPETMQNYLELARKLRDKGFRDQEIYDFMRKTFIVACGEVTDAYLWCVREGYIKDGKIIVAGT